MLWNESRHGVVVRLRNARNELQDVLNLSVPAARYDPVVLADAARQKLFVMVDDLNRILEDIASSR